MGVKKDKTPKAGTKPAKKRPVKTALHNPDPRAIRGSEDRIKTPLETKSPGTEDLLRGILDIVQDAFIRLDQEGRVSMASLSAATMFGYDSANDMHGLSAESLYADVANRQTLYQQLREIGHVADYSVMGRRKDGGTFWVSINAHVFRDKQGNVVGTEEFLRDITERKRDKDKRRESNELLSQFVLNSPIHAYIKGNRSPLPA